MSYTVTLFPFERQFDCLPEETVLDAALRQGINLPFGCKHGGCGSCKIRVTEGDVDLEGCSSFALMDFEREEGFSLLCSTRALTDLTIDVSELTEAEIFGPPTQG